MVSYRRTIYCQKAYLWRIHLWKHVTDILQQELYNLLKQAITVLVFLQYLEKSDQNLSIGLWAAIYMHLYWNEPMGCSS